MSPTDNLFATVFDTLIVEQREGGVAQVTLNRPQAHNAYNANMVAELGQVIESIEQTSHINVVILTGAGEKTFCAGADLQEAWVDGGSGLRNRHGGFNPLHLMPRRKVWIAALNGHAYGGGFEMALHCDLIIAESGVCLSLPETRHSLLPVGGGISQLAKMLPAPLIKELIFTAAPLTAQRAASLGVINQVVERAELLPAAINLAARINRSAPLAVQAANALIDQAIYGNAQDFTVAAERELNTLQRSDDIKESALAFQQKRLPVWKGR